MKLQIILGGVAVACATSANAAGLPDLKSIVGSVDGEYLTYSGSRGHRITMDARTRLNLGDTKLDFAVSEGSRTTKDDKLRATRVQATLVQNWNSVISTRTTVGIASNNSVFVQRELAQDVSFKLLPGNVLTAGGRYARYGGGVDARSWSLGTAQYFRGGFVGYRFSSFDINRLGHAVGHLVSAKLTDPYGANQLWLGRGTALHDADFLISPEKGHYTQLEYRRIQPVGGGVSLSVGAKRSWYDTPTTKFHGTGLRFGLVFEGKSGGLRQSPPAVEQEGARKQEQPEPKVASAN